MTGIVVIGAGVIGASTAFRLAQGGALVTLLDATRAGGGTSLRSFAWLNAHNKQPRGYHALNVAGMQAHVELEKELGSMGWRHGGGCLEWTTDEAERGVQRARADRLQGWGYSVSWISAPEARALEPDLDPAALGDAPVAWYPDEGWMDPGIYIGALLHRFAALGGRLLTGTQVSALLLRGGAVTGVRTARGETIGADLVINCTGGAVNTVTREQGLHVLMASTFGLLAVTAPAAVSLGRVIQGPGGLAMRPDGAGRVMLHSNQADLHLDGSTQPDSGMPEATEMAAQAAHLLTPLAAVPIEAVRIAVRPIPLDGHPVVGPASGVDGYYLAVTHSGVTLASWLGRAIAGEVLDGRPHPALAPFRPDRFARAGLVPQPMEGLA